MPTVNVTVEPPKEQEAPPLIEPQPEPKAPTDFWDLMQEIPKDQWGRIYTVSGWRLEPKVPGVPGSKGFLFMTTDVVTPSWIKQTYGGGKFRMTIEKNSRWWKTHEFEIEGDPKYDRTREIAPALAAANGGGEKELLQQFVGVLRDELQRSREANNSPGQDRVVDMLTNASERAMEIVTRGTPQAQDATAQLANLVGIVKGLLPQPQSGTDLTALLLPKLLDKLMTPVDPMAQVTAFLAIFEKIDAIRGTAGGSDGKPKDWRAMLAEGAVQKGPEILKEIREIVAVNKESNQERRAAAEANARAMEIARTMPGAPPAAPAAAPANGAAAASPMRVVPLDGNGAAPSQPSPAPQPAATATSVPVTAPGMSATESDAVAGFMKRRIVEMIGEDREPEDVVDFIEEVDPSVNNLLVQFSPDMVTTFLAQDSVLNKATLLPNWNAFLVTAQSYIKEIRAEDEAIEVNATHAPS